MRLILIIFAFNLLIKVPSPGNQTEDNEVQLGDNEMRKIQDCHTFPSDSTNTRANQRSLSKYPHKLRLIRPEKGEAFAEEFLSLETISLSTFFNRLVLIVPDPQEARALQKLINKRKDGLVVEKVDPDSYTCGNPAYEEQPSRRNENYFLNGDLLQPVYRDQLYRQLAQEHSRNFRKPTAKKERKLEKAYRRQRKKVPYWLVNLGKATDPGAAYNIMLIKKKKLVSVIEFNSVPGELISAGPLPDMKPHWLPGHFSFSPGTAEIILNIPFELNQASLPAAEAKQLLLIDSLKQLPIRNIDIEAFASVEGDFEINQELHQARASFILSQLQQHLPDTTISYRTRAEENWTEFARQIRHSPYSYLLKQPKIQVKEFLRTSTNDTIVQLLQKQRKAQVRVTFLDTSGKFDTLGIVSNEWDSLIHLSEKEIPQQFSTLIVRKLEVLQKFLYNQYLKAGKGNLPTLVNNPFPREPLFAQLINNRNWFISKLSNTEYTLAEEDINYCSENFEVNEIGKYNYLIFNLKKQNNDKDELERLDFHFKRMNWQSIDKQEKRKIAFNLYRELTLLYSRNLKDFKNMEWAFHLTLENYPIKNQKDTLAAAAMYAEYGYMEKAFVLIEPIIVRNEYDKKTLSFFLKLAVQLPEEMHYEYLKRYQKALGRNDWCRLFNGKNPINFQVFNYAPIRDLYCQICEN